MPEQSEGKNHTSKINVFPVLHTIFFSKGKKLDIFAPQGAIKCTLWLASRKNHQKIPKFFTDFMYEDVFFIRSPRQKWLDPFDSNWPNY